MKEITAYEATDGTIHRTRESAAIASIVHLDRTDTHDGRLDYLLGEVEAGFIVKNRKKIIDILNDIDFVPDKPNYASAC